MSEVLGAIGNAVGSVFSTVFGTVFGFIGDGIGRIISNFFYGLFYQIGTGLCWILDILNQVFSVMSGLTRVTYDGNRSYLMEVFFNNSAIGNAYWGMALIGIVLCFVFAIIAVAKKAADSGDKMRQSMGGILTGLSKGILIILCLTVVINMVMTASDVLLRQISYLFDRADTLDKGDSIVFTDDQYAAMARVLDTIANYSLNPSYNSRYNLNSCYNEIRADLQFLVQRGVFNFYYDSNQQNGPSWQSELQKIVNAANLNQDLNLDIYHEAVSEALLSCMKLLQTDYSFAPLQSYQNQYATTTVVTPLDRMIFLMCTMDAAKNASYNTNASLRDPLRGAYYVGSKSIYNYDSVASDFYLSEIDYIVLYIVAFKLIWDLAVIIINCVARIFNMIFLYIIAPPFIAVMPLDEGGKMKQWTTAFIIQCFGVFGTIIAMRVLLLFIPIVIDSKLMLFDNSTINLMGKMLLILGGISTAKRASGVITGILADNAGAQAVMAGDMGESVRGGLYNAGRRAVGMGAGAVGMGVRTVGMVGSGAKYIYDTINKSREKDKQKRNAEKQQLEEKHWRFNMLDAARNRPERTATRDNGVGSYGGGTGFYGGGSVNYGGGTGFYGGGSVNYGGFPSIPTGGQPAPYGRGYSAMSGDNAPMQSSAHTGATAAASGGATSSVSSGNSMSGGSASANAVGGSAAQGGNSGIPQAPPISQTAHYDAGRDWLPDGDVLTQERFSSQGGVSDMPDGSQPAQRDGVQGGIAGGDGSPQKSSSQPISLNAPYRKALNDRLKSDPSFRQAFKASVQNRQLGLHLGKSSQYVGGRLYPSQNGNNTDHSIHSVDRPSFNTDHSINNVDRPSRDSDRPSSTMAQPSSNPMNRPSDRNGMNDPLGTQASVNNRPSLGTDHSINNVDRPSLGTDHSINSVDRPSGDSDRLSSNSMDRPSDRNGMNDLSGTQASINKMPPPPRPSVLGAQRKTQEEEALPSRFRRE